MDLSKITSQYASIILQDKLLSKQLDSLSVLMKDGGSLDVVVCKLAEFVTKGIKSLSDDANIKDIVSLSVQQEVAQGLVRYFFTILSRGVG